MRAHNRDGTGTGGAGRGTQLERGGTWANTEGRRLIESQGARARAASRSEMRRLSKQSSSLEASLDSPVHIRKVLWFISSAANIRQHFPAARPSSLREACEYVDGGGSSDGESHRHRSGIVATVIQEEMLPAGSWRTADSKCEYSNAR